MKKENAVVIFLSIIFMFVLSSCSTSKIKTKESVLGQIDMLKDYQIVEIEHMTLGMESMRIYTAEYPKPFSAGKYLVTFQKGDKLRYVILETEEKVGHLAKVTPGETVVNGYIELVNKEFSAADYMKDNNKAVLEKDGYKISKSEQEYFIKMLYGKFAQKMTEKDAKNINSVKDYALAIYFNGTNGIDELHKKLSGDSKAAAPAELIKMNIYLYKEKSTKAQPEQVMTIDSENSLSSWEDIFEDKGNENLPNVPIKGIFLYEKQLGKQGQVEQNKYIMFVKFGDGSGYYKEFSDLEKIKLENYSIQKGEELIKQIGRDNWARNPYQGSDHDLWLDEQLK